MRICYTQIILILFCGLIQAQEFSRKELPSALTSPWEIIYGPDNFLWISEAGGKVSRVDPHTGDKTIVYTASDYFSGSALEQNTLCAGVTIGAGTLGMALHPDFLKPSTAFIYFVYSYNSGTAAVPSTKFKIARLKWAANTNSVISDTCIVANMPSGFDHLGGRLIIIPQNGIPYLFFTVGDNGISETNSPNCYLPQSNNPNNLAQDPNYKNGKIHRFNLDGSIPTNNPLAGNSFYTRGHRNPQGLMYNPVKKIIYSIEHGDRTDDEINILESGMNYGWKYVRGYHSDNNYANEANFISSYTPYPGIANDALKEAFYSWCATPQPTISNYLDWCTVAPSDGLYYGSSAIPEWNNSLLVVTLKNGLSSDQELYRFKLQADGKSLVASTTNDPNPKKYFAEDQALNGRLRDLAISPDGTNIYLINNGGSPTDKISVYTYSSTIVIPSISEFSLKVFPNPTLQQIQIQCSEKIKVVDVIDLLGVIQLSTTAEQGFVSLDGLAEGTYFLKIQTNSGTTVIKKVIKRT